MWAIDLCPQAAIPTGANPALVDIRQGWPVVVFPASGSYRADFVAVMPLVYHGEGLRVTLLATFAGDNTPAHRVSLEVALTRLPAADASLYTPAESPPQLVTLPVPPEEGTVVVGEATFSAGEGSAAVAGGDLFRLRVISSTLHSLYTGQCELLRIIVRPLG